MIKETLKMKLQTSYIGEVEYNEGEIITFPEPILGFENLTKYILVGAITDEFPFLWLQSVEDENVVFILTNPFLFVEDYDFNIGDSSIKLLQTDKPEDIEVLTMIVIPSGDTSRITTNLKSPIVINVEKRIATQVVLDEDYDLKHSIFDKGIAC